MNQSENSKLNSIVITGAGSGIGRALSQSLADAGLTVLAIGRRPEALEETASHNTDKILCLPADISSHTDLERIQATAKKLPQPLSVFHGAGIFQISRLAEISQDKWLNSFNVNVTARLTLTQKLSPLLKHGRILFIGSDAGQNIRIGAGAYSIAQSASQTLVEVLKKELLQHSITVGSFKPGLVATDMVETFMQTPAEIFPDVNVYKEWVSSGRITRPEKIAAFAKWLLLETGNEDFSQKAWDVRDQWHHHFWLKGKLFENSATPPS